MTAPLVTVSVEVAHLEQRIVATCGMLDVEDVVEEFREPSVDVELEELEEESEDGEDGPAIVEGCTGIGVSSLCCVWLEWSEDCASMDVFVLTSRRGLRIASSELRC